MAANYEPGRARARVRPLASLSWRHLPARPQLVVTANIILTTVHESKGKAFKHVQLANGILDTTAFRIIDSPLARQPDQVVGDQVVGQVVDDERPHDDAINIA